MCMYVCDWMNVSAVANSYLVRPNARTLRLLELHHERSMRVEPVLSLPVTATSTDNIPSTAALYDGDIDGQPTVMPPIACISMYVRHGDKVRVSSMIILMSVTATIACVPHAPVMYHTNFRTLPHVTHCFRPSRCSYNRFRHTRLLRKQYGIQYSATLPTAQSHRASRLSCWALKIPQSSTKR
jgi:hypothetical protein